MKKLIGITVVLLGIVALVFFLSKQGLRLVPQTAIIPAPSSPITPSPTSVPSGNIILQIKNQKITSGNANISVKQNTQVVIRITSDGADTLQILGYDKQVQLIPNKEVTLSFVADKKGIYALELTNQHLQLGTITIEL